MNRPTPLPTPNLEELTELIEEYFTAAEERVGDDELADFDAQICEAAIEAIYGPRWAKWFNAKTGASDEEE